MSKRIPEPGDSHYVAAVLRAINSLRNQQPTHLQTPDGDVFAIPYIGRENRYPPPRIRRKPQKISKKTVREGNINGMNTRQIAEANGVSPRTVRERRRALREDDGITLPKRYPNAARNKSTRNREQ